MSRKRPISTRSEKMWALSAKHADAESVEDDRCGAPMWFAALADDKIHTNLPKLAKLINQISHTFK